MIQEEIFEVNQKIKQIESILDKRKEKASQWNVPYRTVLQEKLDKATYLQKKCPTTLFLQETNFQNFEQAKLEIVKHCSQSRSKVRTFYNELKELDLLKKKKNRIRFENVRNHIQTKSKNILNSKDSRPKSDKSGNNDFSQSDLCSRTIKDRHNPFLNCKAEKFIELYQQQRSNQDQVGLKIMRHFGVGLENTPIGPILRKQEKKEELKLKKNTQVKCRSNFRKGQGNKKFALSLKDKDHWFKPSPARNMFEDRARKIIKYHGNFWNENLNIQ